VARPREAVLKETLLVEELAEEIARALRENFDPQFVAQLLEETGAITRHRQDVVLRKAVSTDIALVDCRIECDGLSRRWRRE
jgi:hypothetical protein